MWTFSAVICLSELNVFTVYYTPQLSYGNVERSFDNYATKYSQYNIFMIIFSWSDLFFDRHSENGWLKVQSFSAKRLLNMKNLKFWMRWMLKFFFSITNWLNFIIKISVVRSLFKIDFPKNCHQSFSLASDYWQDEKPENFFQKIWSRFSSSCVFKVIGLSFYIAGSTESSWNWVELFDRWIIVFALSIGTLLVWKLQKCIYFRYICIISFKIFDNY